MDFCEFKPVLVYILFQESQRFVERSSLKFFCLFFKYRISHSSGLSYTCYEAEDNPELLLLSSELQYRARVHFIPCWGSAQALCVLGNTTNYTAFLSPLLAFHRKPPSSDLTVCLARQKRGFLALGDLHLVEG